MEQVGFFNHLTWGEDIFLLVIEYATGIFTETVAKGVCFKTNKQATLTQQTQKSVLSCYMQDIQLNI